MLKQDIQRHLIILPGKGLKKTFSAILIPGIRAVIVLRFGQWIKRKGILIKIMLTPLYVLLNQRIRSKWGIEIPRSTRVGPGLRINHHGGIIVNGESIIGSNVSISQGVTIGASKTKGHHGSPTIGDEVYIAPGVVIYGKINIGNNVKIGPNAVIYKDIPDNAIVTSSPGFKILSTNGNRRLRPSQPD